MENLSEPERKKGKSLAWHFYVWPTLALWVMVWVYVALSPFRDQAKLVVPLLMVASVIIVILLNVIFRSLSLLPATRAAVTVERREGDVEGGNMSEAGVRRIETELGARMPEDYRKLVTDFPKEMVGLGIVRKEVFNEPHRVIEENLRVRGGDDSYLLFDWPATFFIIGESGTEDYFCIDIHQPHSPVYHFERLGFLFKRVAESLEEWVPEIIAEKRGGGKEAETAEA